MKKLVIPILIVSILIIVLVGLGILFFTSLVDEPFLSNEKDGYVLQALTYGKNGRAMGGLQTVVGGQPGIFWMSFKLLASNSGNVVLNGLRMTESHPSEYDDSLQNAPPFQDQLSIGESNVLEWNTANSCSLDSDCGSSERCLNDICLIDISNFLGEITFGATLEADFIDALGNPDTTSLTINLPITFEQDKVALRFEILHTNPLSTFQNTWIAFDENNDGTLVGFGSTNLITDSTESCSLPTDPEFVTFYGNFIIEKISSIEIRVCENRVTSGSDYISFLTTNPEASNAITTSGPLEPYQSLNCEGSIPCQEIYSIVVAPPEQTCGNNIREGSELCDGTDLDSNSCTTVPGGFTGGTLDCSLNCLAWDTTSCTGGINNVNFKTGINTYDYVSVCNGNSASGNRWISHSNSCGVSLTPYGYVSSTSSSGTTCEERVTLDSWIELETVPYFPQGNCELNSAGNGVAKLYDCSAERGAGTLCICESDVGGGSVYKYFRTSDSDGDDADTSFSSVDPLFEISC